MLDDRLEDIMGKFLEPLVKDHGERYRKLISSALEYYYERQNDWRPTSGAFNIKYYIKSIIDAVERNDI